MNALAACLALYGVLGVAMKRRGADWLPDATLRKWVLFWAREPMFVAEHDEELYDAADVAYRALERCRP